MDLKKLTGGITTSFNRAIQFTEEKLGQAERTDYDPEFESLLRLADQSERCAERLTKAMEAVMQPNPAHRVEDLLCDKLDAGRRERTTPLEDLGGVMAAAGQELRAAGDGRAQAMAGAEAAMLSDVEDAGSATAGYATALELTGEAELGLARLERDFAGSCGRAFVRPLREHLAGDARAVQRERRALENFRLDLDSARSRLRRCRGDDAARRGAEQECDKLEADFEHQMQVTRLMLESIAATHDHHLNCLKDLIEAQTLYHSECLNRLQSLRHELSRY